MKERIILLVLFLILFITSCNTKPAKELSINGSIKGLTKGTIYLEKLKDSTFAPVDSFKVRDNGKFTVGDALESPEIYYLRIKEKPEESILIFGEKGNLEVTSKLDKFTTAAKVTGSTNHDLLTAYKEMIQKFNDSRLDLFKANIEAEQAQDQQAIDSLNKVHANLIRRRYLYTANFAVTHADKEIAPYLALTELYNANLSLLDTVNTSLTAQIQQSKYGKQLDRFITVVKKNERAK